MLSLHAARHRRGNGRAPRIGLAIAGGGPTGAMYELGALRALDEACDGLDLTRLDCYVGRELRRVLRRRPGQPHGHRRTVPHLHQRQQRRT